MKDINLNNDKYPVKLLHAQYIEYVNQMQSEKNKYHKFNKYFKYKKNKKLKLMNLIIKSKYRNRSILKWSGGTFNYLM